MYYICISLSIHIYIYIYVHIHICVYIYIYMHVHVYLLLYMMMIHVYIYIYVYVHKYIHKCLLYIYIYNTMYDDTCHVVYKLMSGVHLRAPVRHLHRPRQMGGRPRARPLSREVTGLPRLVSVPDFSKLHRFDSIRITNIVFLFET